MDRDKLASAMAKDAPGVEFAFDQPMAPMTSLALGGPADVMVSPRSEADAMGSLTALGALGMEVTALGGGTNLLVRDGGMGGAVISLGALDGLEVYQDNGGEVVLRAGAGLPMSRLLGYARKEGLSGIEGLSGVPGTLGGAVAGNAGSFGSEIMDVIREVTLCDIGGRVSMLVAGQFTPGYRSSGLPQGGVIVSALVALRRDDRVAVVARMDDALRKKNDTQPLGQHTAGCVFKNPEGDFAARLIDAAGCKGMRVGAIEVSALHAGFFINRGGGAAGDFLGLMDAVASRVMDEFGVELEPEIRVVGRDA